MRSHPSLAFENDLGFSNSNWSFGGVTVMAFGRCRLLFGIGVSFGAFLLASFPSRRDSSALGYRVKEVITAGMSGVVSFDDADVCAS